LAYIESEKSGKKLDEFYIMKKVIFHSFRDLVLSDINSGTKEYIKRIDPDIFGKIHKKSFDFLFDFDAPEYLKDDMKQIVFDDSDRVENQIILAAKKYVGYTEALSNAAVFPFMYEVPLSEISSQINEMKQDLFCFRELMDNTDHQKYLAHVNRLSFSMRWNHLSRKFPISVMSHLVIVAFISYIIGMIENQNG